MEEESVGIVQEFSRGHGKDLHYFSLLDALIIVAKRNKTQWQGSGEGRENKSRMVEILGQNDWAAIQSG